MYHVIEFLFSFFLFSFFSFFYSEMKSQNSAFICFLAAFTEPCAKNGLPPPRPFNSLFTFFTSSLMSPFRSPMAYLYPSVSLPAKRALCRRRCLKWNRCTFDFCCFHCILDEEYIAFPSKGSCFYLKAFLFFLCQLSF